MSKGGLSWKIIRLIPALFCVIVHGQSDLRLDDRFVEAAQSPLSPDFQTVCNKIAQSISPDSNVYYPGSPDFIEDISHWANTSSQVSACSVRPGTPQDIGIILGELAETRTPFAVKGGGHIANPKFSSTSGVHISLAKFKDIVINEDAGTVDIGAGLTWTDVYEYLVPKGLNVVGGRVNGVGVAGFTLGGGYSWKTNQFGLTIDTLTAVELVLPSGSVKTVTEKDEDLFFALKGGFNNYGIATKFTLKTHKQPPNVWSVSITFLNDQLDAAEVAYANFLSEPHDGKAAQLGEYAYVNGTATLALTLFYDGPEPPQGLFDDLLKVPSTSQSIVNGTFIDFVNSVPAPILPRVYFHGVPIENYTLPIMKAYVNESKFWGTKFSEVDPSVFVVYSTDPFESDILTHGGPSPYPADRSQRFCPSSIYFGWSDESLDEEIAQAMRTSAATLHQVGLDDGQKLQDAPPYINYALFGTPLEQMYGKNLPRMREIREKYDPDRIMGLAGGWKF
ncbi:FAD-binding domain-containing protein [Gloeopeniophorella convolvens]|nr:FAD-binding domain-containing protein [Gloeopeniophorella convolvens]